MTNEFTVVEAIGLIQLDSVLNEPPEGYKLHSWAPAYSSEDDVIYYTVVFSKATA